MSSSSSSSRSSPSSSSIAVSPSRGKSSSPQSLSFGYNEDTTISGSSNNTGDLIKKCSGSVEAAAASVAAADDGGVVVVNVQTSGIGNSHSNHVATSAGSVIKVQSPCNNNNSNRNSGAGHQEEEEGGSGGVAVGEIAIVSSDNFHDGDAGDKTQVRRI